MGRRDIEEGIGDRFQQETKYLDSCQVGAFYDDEVNALLDVDGTEESVIYIFIRIIHHYIYNINASIINVKGNIFRILICVFSVIEMEKEEERGNPVRVEIEELIEAGDLRSLLYKAGELHGHLCGHLAYGVKAGYIAMRELGLKSKGMEEVIAIIETNNCFSDGLQMVTGCSFGNNALIYRDFGKTAVTVAKRDGTAMRIALNPEFEDCRKDVYPEAYKLFDKIVAKREKPTPEEHERLMQLFSELSIAELEEPADEMFITKRLEIVVPEYAPIFDSVRCSICGENVMISRAVAENGEYFCFPCYNRGYYQMDGSGISFEEKILQDEDIKGGANEDEK